MPNGLLVRDGESVIVTEVFFDFEPMLMQEVLDPETIYKFAAFRPRFSSLKTISP